MNDFYWDLFGKSRATPYPAADITRATAAIPDLADPPRSRSPSEAATRPARCLP